MTRAKRQRDIFLGLALQLDQEGAFTSKHFPSKVAALLAKERRFGSRDRKLYRALLFATVRLWPWISGRLSVPGASDLIIAYSDAPDAFKQEALGDALAAACEARPLNQWPAWASERLNIHGLSWEGLLPAWFEAQCPEAFQGSNAAALLSRKPLWIRRQRGSWEEIERAFAAEEVLIVRSSAYPDAATVVGEPDITDTQPWLDGMVEIQDLGSQRVLEAVPVSGRWLDACAGAGGKTLQLALRAAKVVASDVRPQALAQLRERAKRAKLSNVQTGMPTTQLAFDGVLVDAPCSGTGTWGRHPHMRSATNPEDISTAAALQLKLLTQFAPFVKEGGLLVYATCSLCADENQHVVNNFLSAHPTFSAPNPGSTIWPQDHDGFFVATLTRT